MKLLKTKKRNDVLQSMINIIDRRRDQILDANKKDLDAFDREDQALYDRLVVTNEKIDGMMQAIQQVKGQEDPVGKEIGHFNLENGLEIINKTDPFGTIMIIYESRPDVTIEAAVLAFKANNKILLKGGKEAINSNEVLVDCWHEALAENDLQKDWIKMLQMSRQETQDFLKNPTEKLDLVVPRGGERLISFVKENANCAVLVSGRGNNFMYISPNANWEKTINVLLNSKTDKTSACNALDNVLLDRNIDSYEDKLKKLSKVLLDAKVEIIVDKEAHKILKEQAEIKGEDVWKEEFLAMKILIGMVESKNDAIEKINENSGKHSTIIMTEDRDEAMDFMQQIDSAAVYQNASSRFTDGGAMGVGAELAISTDKLHHRGPLGLEQLTTNKYYVFGDGQIR